MRLVPGFLRSHPSSVLRPVDSASRTALLLSSAVNLGFQATQSIMIYPELFSEPSNLREPAGGGGATRRSSVAERQREHVRSAVPMLATLYPMLGASALWAAATTRDSAHGRSRVATWVSILAALGGPVVTAGVTTRLHASVAEDPTPGRVHSLIAADRLRTVLAAVGVISAVRAVQPDG